VYFDIDLGAQWSVANATNPAGPTVDVIVYKSDKFVGLFIFELLLFSIFIMKINCTCKNVIIDQSDYLNDKGHVISDAQWFDFWDSVDNAIENTGKSPKEKEAACMQLRNQNLFKTLWECQSCGKLFANGPDGNLISYSPDNNRYNQLLNKKEVS
jgi:hypothetical protein